MPIQNVTRWKNLNANVPLPNSKLNGRALPKIWKLLKWFWRFSIARSQGKKNKIVKIARFSVCSQKCRSKSKDLYFIFGSLKILTRMEFLEASTTLLLGTKLPEYSTSLQPDMKVSWVTVIKNWELQRVWL
jgi:hypothetical protein